MSNGSSGLNTVIRCLGLEDWLLLRQHLYHACNVLCFLPLCILIRRVLERVESTEEPQLLKVTYEGRDVLGGFDLTAWSA